MARSPALTDKVAVILGGSGGIGAAAAKLFADEGATVVVTYRSDKAGAEALVASLPGKGHLAAPAVMEDSPSLQAVADLVQTKLGRADILVNSAGYTKPVPANDLDGLTDDFIDEMMRVNFRGQFAAIRIFRKLLEASGEGLVINVSSLAAQTGQGSNIAYAGAKAALDSMSKGLARALAPAIRVMTVSPGAVDTDFVPGRGAEQLAKLAPTIPLKRVATADDCAKAIVACATHLPYSTGSIILVEGGRAL
jgi:3-oxoacyl-[acyl-carrier protein] reductase